MVLIEKDPFVDAVAQQSQAIGFRNTNVRRPLHGIAIKAPRFAFLSVYQANFEGNLVPISLHDSSAPGGRSNANHNFILQKHKMTRQEKMQVVETFGPHFAFFYGERPTFISCSGMLLNTRDFNWKNEWIRNYDEFLRGTKATENRSRVYLGLDDVLLEGYIAMSDIDYSEDIPYLCPFSFQMLVTNYIDLSVNSGVIDLSQAEVDVASLGLGFYDYVTRAEHARTYVDGPQQGLRPEYLSEVVQEDNWVIDPFTGEAHRENGDTGDVVASTDGSMSPRSAGWVSGAAPGQRQWKTEDEALTLLTASLSAQESGADSVTARRQLRESPESFTLGRRTTATSLVAKSLGTGIANSCAVLDSVE